jgi:hypothetical protein
MGEAGYMRFVKKDGAAAGSMAVCRISVIGGIFNSGASCNSPGMPVNARAPIGQATMLLLVKMGIDGWPLPCYDALVQYYTALAGN